MEIKEQSKLVFKGVDFVKVNYEAYPEKDSENKHVEIDIHPRLLHNKENRNIFFILFDVSLKVEEKFMIDLMAVGHFEIEGDTDDLLFNSFINTNAPAIVFPYIRSFISTFTANLGSLVKPLILPPFNFKGPLDESDIEDQKEE